jgi:recombination associated protein RdgC
MTWADRISFVLTESLAIKRIAPLDVLKEGTDSSTKNDDERFDSDLVLMSGELSRLMTALVEALGGEKRVA